MWQLPDLTLVLDSLGWAVLHSTWQGALAALLFWGLRTFTKENAADVRYMGGMIMLLVFSQRSSARSSTTLASEIQLPIRRLRCSACPVPVALRMRLQKHYPLFQLC